MRCDVAHMVRCCAYGPMRFFFVQTRSVGSQTDATRCIWSDAVLVCTTKDQSDNPTRITSRCDAMRMVRCDAYGPRRCIWSEAVHMVRCDAVHMVRCDAVRCIWCIWSDAVLVCTKKISRIIRLGLQTDAMRCIRSDAMHMVRCCSCLYKKDQSDNPTRITSRYRPMRRAACDVVRC